MWLEDYAGTFFFFSLSRLWSASDPHPCDCLSHRVHYISHRSPSLFLFLYSPSCHVSSLLDRVRPFGPTIWLLYSSNRWPHARFPIAIHFQRIRYIVTWHIWWASFGLFNLCHSLSSFFYAGCDANNIQLVMIQTPGYGYTQLKLSAYFALFDNFAQHINNFDELPKVQALYDKRMDALSSW